MSLFTDVQYTFEQKRLSVGDVYEIKDRAQNLVCRVKSHVGAADIAEKATSVAEYIPVDAIPGLGPIAKMTKRMMAAKLFFETPDGKKLFEILKGKSWKVKNTIFEMKNNDGNVLASISLKAKILGGIQYFLQDPTGNELAKTKGNLTKHNYVITNANGKEIGKIHKKWLKMMKDAYTVDIFDKTLDPLFILAFAVAIDFIEH